MKEVKKNKRKKPTQKNPNGRPLAFKSEEALKKAVKEYFDECEKHTYQTITKQGDTIDVNYPQIPTIAGLAYALGVERQTIYNYEKREKFFDTIKKAREYVFSKIEGKLANTNQNAGGIIFLAKNYGYSENQEKQGDLTDQEIYRLKQIIYKETSENI